MAAEAPREDARGLHGRSVAKVRHRGEGPDREAPRPADACGVVLRVADDLDDREDGLPHGRVADGEVAPLDRGAPRGRMPAQRSGVDVGGQRTIARPANEQPVRFARLGERGRDHGLDRIFPERDVAAPIGHLGPSSWASPTLATRDVCAIGIPARDVRNIDGT